MDNIILIVFGLVLAAFILNIPFGYMRGPSKKFSLPWMLYIHAPIPFVFLLRSWAEMSMKIIPLLLIGAVAGQVIGSRLNPKTPKRAKKKAEPLGETIPAQEQLEEQTK